MSASTRRKHYEKTIICGFCQSVHNHVHVANDGVRRRRRDNGIVTSESGLCEHHTQHDESCGYTEGTAEIPCSHEHNENCGGLTDPEACNHTHDKACDFVPATEGTPCTFVCEVCNAQDSGNPATPSDAQPEECTCETLCTGEEINGDCPVCSAEGAELDKVCVGAAYAARHGAGGRRARQSQQQLDGVYGWHHHPIRRQLLPVRRW